MNILPNGIYRLEYNEKARCFHYEDDTDKNFNHTGWVILKTLSEADCIDFCSFMDKKYVNGRISGILPELSIVQLELDLFMELKKYRRQLAGRV